VCPEWEAAVKPPKQAHGPSSASPGPSATSSRPPAAGLAENLLRELQGRDWSPADYDTLLELDARPPPFGVEVPPPPPPPPVAQHLVESLRQPLFGASSHAESCFFCEDSLAGAPRHLLRILPNSSQHVCHHRCVEAAVVAAPDLNPHGPDQVNIPAVYSCPGAVIGCWLQYIPVQGLGLVVDCCMFLSRGYDWLLTAVYSCPGAVIGCGLQYVPVQGLWLVVDCGMFLSRGCDWLLTAVCSCPGAVIGCWLQYVPVQGLWLVVDCSMFLSRGCDWLWTAVYSFWGLRLVPWQVPIFPGLVYTLAPPISAPETSTSSVGSAALSRNSSWGAGGGGSGGGGRGFGKSRSAPDQLTPSFAVVGTIINNEAPASIVASSTTASSTIAQSTISVTSAAQTPAQGRGDR
jgi:hypothetical protein